MIQRFLFEEDGQTLVEYALLISLLSLVVIAVLTVMGRKTQNVFGSAAEAIEAGQPAKPGAGG